MFTDKDDNFVQVDLETTRFLGRAHVGKGLVEVLQKHDSIYIPERWDTEDRARLRYEFDDASIRLLMEEWMREEEWKLLCFSRKRPSAVDMWFNIQRGSHIKFNDFHACIDEKHFKSIVQERELLNLTIDMCRLINADYGSIAHIEQGKRQSAVLTPAERLPGIYWANLFGRPYIEFFGREKLLATPCYEVGEINDDLILLLTAESLNAPEMIESDKVVNQIKEYLNQNAFAGPNFPEEPCAVPEFNFGDVRWTTELPVEESPDEKLARLRTDLEAKGYKLIEEKNGRLIFRGDDNSVVLVDRDKAEISVDMTGEFLLKTDSSSPKR